MKIGIFGGSFNPLHSGHLAGMQTVLKKIGLTKIILVPAFQNPLKKQVEGPSPKQRLEMARLAIESYGNQFQVDDQEIVREGKSYTIDTIKFYRKQYEANDLNLIYVYASNWRSVSTGYR